MSCTRAEGRRGDQVVMLEKVLTLMFPTPSGGGHTSQVYAIRQAIAKAVVAYTAKYQDAATSLDLKKQLVSYDRSLLVADPRRMEPKKFGALSPSNLSLSWFSLPPWECVG